MSEDAGAEADPESSHSVVRGPAILTGDGAYGGVPGVQEEAAVEEEAAAILYEEKGR